MRIPRLLALFSLAVAMLYVVVPATKANEAAAPAAAATILVNTYLDQFDDDANPNSANTPCSLREALDLALGSGDRGCGTLAAAVHDLHIVFIGSGTYKLTINEALADIGSGYTITIDDWGVIFDGGKQSGRYWGIFRVVGGTLKLKNVTLQNGNRPFGGAIWVAAGTLNVDNVKFLNNGMDTGGSLTTQGGAIQVDTGTLNVTNSLFQGNVAVEAAGALATSFGTITKTKFIGNKAFGGGAMNIQTPTTYPVEIADSEFKQNEARRMGLIPINYVPSNDLFAGGAIQNDGNLHVVRTLFEGNKSDKTRGGGGLSNEPGSTAVLEDCVFTGNKAALHDSANFSWGGAILNGGQLDLERCSIYGNEADMAGAIFNGYNGRLRTFNSTITGNNGTYQYGGLVNEHSYFNNSFSFGGAQMFLYHTTIGKNPAGQDGPGANELYSAQNDYVVFSNSILATGCKGTQYSFGNSVMTDICTTITEPTSGITETADVSQTQLSALALQALTNGSANVPKYKVQPIDSNSTAVDIGRNDQFTCNHPLILRKDQNQADRGVGGTNCDAGAIEVGQQPPFYTSNPTTGLVQFPIVDFSQGMTQSTVQLGITNSGGGAMTYAVVDEGSGNGITSLSPPQGTLFKNQQTTLGFLCQPAAAGDYWKIIDIHTNASNKTVANYKFRCTGVGAVAQPSMNEQPGPYNMPSTAPGQTTNGTVTMKNAGHQPMTANYSLSDTSPMWSASGAKQAPQNPGAFTLNPGESLKVDFSCTPPGTGVYINTLLLTSNAPGNPNINYDLACEGAVNWPAEALLPDAFYSTPAPIEGITISPEGNQLLAAAANGTTVRIFSRDPADGTLLQYASIAAPGMSYIYDIAYSHDGDNVYYTSQVGDGVVMADRSGFALSVSQVMTSGTIYLCSVVNGFPHYCPIGSMDGAKGLAVSPDDKNVYVTGYSDGSITAFNRNLSTGRLSYLQSVTHTINNVSVLSSPTRIVISPDGRFVYVADIGGSSVHVYQRDSSGRLTFVAYYQDYVNGLTTLGHPTDLTLSPDGQFMYVTANLDNAVSIFTRSEADGQLSFVQAITVPNAYGIATTHDDNGKRIFVTEFSSDKVQVYGRSVLTGGLSLVGTYTHLTPTSNINGPAFFAVSPDDNHIYTALDSGQGVRLFSTVHAAPVLGQISPASAVAGSGSFTLTMHGGRFYPNSKVTWNISSLTTQFISDHELQAVVPGGNILSTGPEFVSVLNATPGGGLATPVLTFTVTAIGAPPVPSIDSVEPPAASFGSDDLVIIVHGANFAANAQVSYNGHAVPTTFINDQTLQAALSAAVLTEDGTGGLAVSNGGVAGAQALRPSAPSATGTSARVGFTVSAPDKPALPSAGSLQPASVVSGTSEAWLTVFGYNFTPDSVGRWNGQARTTALVDGTQLKMYLTADDLRTAGSVLVSVFTPGPGESEPLPFKIRLANEKPIPVLTSIALDFRGAGTLYVNGSDFDGAAQIRINGVARTTTFVNSSQLKLTLTPTDTGGVISVRNPTPGGGVTGELPFTVRRLYLPAVWR